MNSIDAIRINNNPQMTFKAERVIYPNEFVFDDLEEKKPNFDFLDKKEEEVVAVKPKKENIRKKMSEISENLSEFFKATKQYYRYKKGVELAVKINVISKERAKQLLGEQKVILFNILKK